MLKDSIRRLWIALRRPRGAPQAKRALMGVAAAAFVLAVSASPLSANTTTMSLQATFAGVTLITDLTASSGPSLGQITLQWTAPTYYGASPPLSYQIKASSTANMNTLGDFTTAQALSVFSPTAIPVPAAAGVTQSMVVSGLTPCQPYFFAMRGVDSGVPQLNGGWMRIVPRGVNVNNFSSAYCRALKPPQAPYGVALTSAATSVSLRWMPVLRFEDFSPFAASSAPAPGELSAYHVYRATSATLGGWTDMSGNLSTATLTWTDLAGEAQYYYHVRAENTDGLSLRSTIRTGSSNAAFVVAPDDRSYFMIPPQDIAPIEGILGDPNSAYLIQASSHAVDLGTLDGRVVKSVAFDAYQGGLTPAPAFALAGLGVLNLHYGVSVSSSGSLVTPSSLQTRAVAASPGNMSVYWDNGHGWVQLYGKLSAADQMMTIQTKYFGRYQLRTVERTGAFAFNQAGVSNRIVTPNGDGKNDTVVFTYDNPHDAQVVIRLLDIRGKLVVSDLPTGPVSNSKVWNGTAGGRPVPGGIYIYQIESEGHVYSGTIVIVK